MRALRRTAPFLLCVSACAPGEPPGDSLGKFAVVGRLESNSCGQAAVPAEDSLQLSVEIRIEGDQLAQWVLDRPPGIYGTLDHSGHFHFTDQRRFIAIEAYQERPRDAEPSDFWTGRAAEPGMVNPGCTLLITERISGRLVSPLDQSHDAGPSATVPLVGTNTLEVTPAVGSDCRAALVEHGGPFPTFPCGPTYRLEGRWRD